MVLLSAEEHDINRTGGRGGEKKRTQSSVVKKITPAVHEKRTEPWTAQKKSTMDPSTRSKSHRGGKEAWQHVATS